MTLEQILADLPITVLACANKLNQPVTGGFASDLLSNVMGQAQAGNIWVTMQGHQNIVAVASLLGLAAIVLAGGVNPDVETVSKAEREGVVLLTTTLSTYAVCGKLYQLGVQP